MSGSELSLGEPGAEGGADSAIAAAIESLLSNQCAAEVIAFSPSFAVRGVVCLTSQSSDRLADAEQLQLSPVAVLLF